MKWPDIFGQAILRLANANCSGTISSGFSFLGLLVISIADVEHLHKQREAHRKVDVALVYVFTEPLGGE